MADVKKRIRIIKEIFKGNIPKEYLTKEQRRSKSKYVYSSEDKKFNAIYQEMASCTYSELKNMQILLKCELHSWSRMRDFKSVVPLTISIYALVLSSSSPFLVRQLVLNEEVVKITNQNNNNGLLEGYQGILKENFYVLCYILVIILVITVICILIYLALNTRSSKLLDRTTYLLETVSYVLDEKKQEG